MALTVAADFLLAARRILQDTAEIKRYPDADLTEALNAALRAARKMRPDLFIGRAAGAAALPIDQQYANALVYYMVSEVTLRDEEEGNEARTAGLRKQFTAILMGPEA